MKVRTALRACVVVALLAVFPAGAQAATLYTTLDQPSDVSGTNAEFTEGTGRIAQAFTPTTAGTARTMSFYAAKNFGPGTATVTMAIHGTNPATGTPNFAPLATGTGTVIDQTTTSPTCVVLNAAVALSTSQYWAVFRGVSEGANWFFQRQQTRQVLFSSNSGSTWAQSGVQKTFSLRVDDSTACGPDITPNPTPGTPVGDMYATAGGNSFQTITAGNSGNATLTLTGASFTGTNASSFRLLRGEPNGPANQPYVFPRTIGATSTGVEILYVVCDGSTPDGIRRATFTLRSDDPDEAAISWPVECLIDSTPPSIEYSQTPNGLAGWWVSSPALLTIRGIDPESGNRVKALFCGESSGQQHSFPGSVTFWWISGDGTHAGSCGGTDVANNTSAAYPFTVKIDTTAPVTTKVSGPDGPTNAASATFSFTTTELTSGLAAVECRLDAAAYAACTSPVTHSGLTEIAHSFSVRTRDVAGNVGTTTWNFRVDLTLPQTTLTGGPGALTTSATATFAPGGSDPGGFPGVTLQCSLDGAAYTACPSPMSYAGLGEGAHVVSARAVDAAGNIDASPASFTWDVDRTAPTARVVTGPAVHTAATSATFTFAADAVGAAPNARFECRVHGAAFAACASPITLDGLAAEQSHVLEVRAVDVLGNVQAPATAFTWRVTNTPLAADDRATTGAGTAVVIDVLANDVEPLGGALTISTFSAASAQGGAVTQAPGGLSYAPPAGFSGTDTFTYRVTGSTGLESEVATVTVEVAPPPPVVVPPPVGGAGTPVVPAPPAPARDRVAPKITKVTVVGRRLNFKLSEAAKVTIRVERRVNRRWKVVARAGAKRSVKLGNTLVMLPRGLLVGRYRVTLSAVDAAGNKARNVQAGFRVKKV